MTHDPRPRVPRAEELVAYAMGELNPGPARRLEARLAESEELRNRLDEIRSVLEAVRTIPDPQPTPALRARVVAIAATSPADDRIAREPRLRWNEVPAFVSAYVRIRLQTSAGLRALTLATAFALHAVLLSLIAGMTVARLRPEPDARPIAMVPSAGESEGEDFLSLEEILPKSEPEVSRHAPRFRDSVPAPSDATGGWVDERSGDGPSERVPADLWSEVPERENRLLLGRWFLFARHRGDRREDRVRTFGGSDEAEAAVARALEYLVARQRPDGGFEVEGGGGDPHYEVATSALAFLALLGNGHTPDRGAHGPSVERGIDFLLASQAATGRLGPVREVGLTYLYNHAFALQALVEAQLMSDRPLEREIRSAIAFVESAVNRDGGWRHVPVSGSEGHSDASVSAVVLQALGLAAKAGFETNDEVATGASRWLAELANEGRVSYRVEEPESTYWLGRSAGVFWALGLAGRGSDDLAMSIRKRLQSRLATVRPDELDPLSRVHVTLASFQLGGSTWNRWHRISNEALLERQQPDGSFPDGGRFAGPGGRTASTALGALALETYYRFPRLDPR